MTNIEEQLKKVEAGDYLRIIYRDGGDKVFETAGEVTDEEGVLFLDCTWINEDGLVNGRIDEVLVHRKPELDLTNAVVIVADSASGCWENLAMLWDDAAGEWIDQDGDRWGVERLANIRVLVTRDQVEAA